MHRQDLLAEEGYRPQRDIAPTATDIRLQLQKRELVMDVPHEIRRKNQECDGAPDPEPAVGKPAALRSQDQAQENAATEDQHGVLVFQPDSRHDPNQIQSFGFPVLMIRTSRQAQASQNNPSKAFIERMLSSARKPGATSIGGRNTLGKEPPAQLARQHGSERDLDCSSHRREEANGWERIIQQRASHPGDQRNQRRLVHITPIQVPAAREIIKLVDEIAVVPARIQVHQELEGTDVKDQFGCAG